MPPGPIFEIEVADTVPQLGPSAFHEPFDTCLVRPEDLHVIALVGRDADLFRLDNDPRGRAVVAAHPRDVANEPTQARASGRAVRLARSNDHSGVLCARVESGRGERRQTTATDLFVPVRLPLRIEVHGPERWFRTG